MTTNAPKKPAVSPNLLKYKKFYSYRSRLMDHNKKPRVVIVDNEPMVEIYAKNGEPEILSLERLQLLDSELLTAHRFGKTASGGTDYGVDAPTLYQLLVIERARLGQNLILDAWAKEGYTAPEFVKPSKANSKIVLGTLIPTLKNPASGRGKKDFYKGVLVFQENEKTGEHTWALLIKENKKVLSTAPWNDFKAIEELANTCIDKDSVGVVFTLTDPKAVESLMAKKKLDEATSQAQGIAKRYFADAIFSNADKAKVLNLIEKYNTELTAASKRANKAYPILNLGPESIRKGNVVTILRFPIHEAVAAKPITGELGLYAGKRRDIVELQFSLGMDNGYNDRYYEKTPDYRKYLKEQEKVLWEKLSKGILLLGFTIINSRELSGISADDARLLGSERKLFVTLRSFKIVKNAGKHDEAFKNNQSEAKLHAYAKKQLRKQTVGNESPRAKKSSNR